MRVSLFIGLLLGATAAFGQTGLFDSGLSNSLLAADTVPLSLSSVKSASDFGGFDIFAAGSWVEIKGNSLSETTRIWEGPDFTGGGLIAPTSLDRVSVTVNNRPAFVYYVSPTQVNAQIPDDPTLLTGPVEVRLTNASGSQATFVGAKRQLAPGMLAPAAFNVRGKQFMVAQFQDLFYVGDTGLIPGVAFRPAKPGDILTAYGIGFGNVTPSIAPGTVVTAANRTSAPVTISFDQTEATLTYQGLAPNFVGLYQFNIVVPNVADGDHQINLSINGVAPQQPAMFLTTKR